MYKPITLYIAARYLRAKKRSHFISFISFVSLIGIALGVTVLITVLSVMNGFDEHIRDRIFGMARQVTITEFLKPLEDWESVSESVARYSQVTEIVPYIDGYGLATSDLNVTQPAAVTGILPEREVKVNDIEENMLEGSIYNLMPGEYGILLGETLAANLGVWMNDKVILTIPQATLTPAASVPRFRRFTVEGIFRVGNGFGFDSTYAFIHLQDASRLFQTGNDVTGLRLKLHDLYTAPQVSLQLSRDLGHQYMIRNWTDEWGGLFEALRLDKTIMFIIVTLIIAVAAFNLVSSLMMMVNSKRAEIAILRTIGATPRDILLVFILQGFIIGSIATLLGLIGGIVLANNITAIVHWVEYLFNIVILPQNVYFVNFVPSTILLKDLVVVCSIALVLSLLSTLYPAWRAAKTQPAEALRYE